MKQQWPGLTEVLRLANLTGGIEAMSTMGQLHAFALLPPDAPEAARVLVQVVQEAKIICTSQSRYARSLALNRAVGSVGALRDKTTGLSESEQAMLETVAARWMDILLTVVQEETGIL